MEDPLRSENHTSVTRAETQPRCTVTRAAFEGRLRGIAFHDWEEFEAAATASSPFAESSEPRRSALTLNPLHVFTWLAGTLLNVPIWLVIAKLELDNNNPDKHVLGVFLVLTYGFCLRLLIVRKLEPTQDFAHITPLLWPLVPAAVFAAGGGLTLIVEKDILQISHDAYSQRAIVVLLLACLPHLAVSMVLFRPALDEEINQNPHRACLFVNVFIGALVTALASWAIVGGKHAWRGLFDCFQICLGVLAILTIWVAVRLHRSTRRAVYLKVLKWMVNVSAVAIFVDSCVFLFREDNHPVPGWPWLVFALMMLVLCSLAAFFRRSLPLVLCCAGYFVVAIRGISAVTNMLEARGVSSDSRTLVELVMFATIGLIVLFAVMRWKQIQDGATGLVRSPLQGRLGLPAVHQIAGSGGVSLQSLRPMEDSTMGVTARW